MPHEEAKASQEIDALLRDSDRTFVLEMNGHRVKPKDLMITLKFNSCKHTKTIHIKELLRYQHTVGVPFTETLLLSKWKGILNSNTTLTTSFNCVECMKAKQKKLREDHRYSDTDRIGTCRFMLKVI